MSEVTNKQIADAFRAARPAIASGKFEFICHAIKYVSDCVITDTARDVVQGRIQAGIRGVNCHEDWRTTLNSYLQYVHAVSSAEFWTDEGIEKMRNTRLAWLDSLIAEFDKPGYYKQ